MKIMPLEDNDLIIHQGGVLDRRYVVVDEEDPDNTDLTGYTGECTVATASEDESGTVVLTPTVVVDTVNSIVQIYDDTLADLRAVPAPANGHHVFGVYITGAGGDRWCVAYGRCRVVLEPAHA
ncbi:MAG: hypothetical protein GYA36_21615 [Veillonellaceae bacterium]|nr:hypothetical protein [Veillonellaceae bacterium]